MSSGFYTKAKEALLNGGINLETDTIKVLLIDDGSYTPNYSTDQYLSDVPGGARIGTAQTLSNKTFTGGVFDADDVTFTAVTGASVESALYYKDTGSAATSPLLCIEALSSAVTPNGGDIGLAHDNGTNRIFKL
jgi:hypothetical protein